jgi:hypothetical protein
MLRFTEGRNRIDKLFNAECEQNLSNRSGAHPYRHTARERESIPQKNSVVNGRGGAVGLKTCKSVKTSGLISFFTGTFRRHVSILRTLNPRPVWRIHAMKAVGSLNPRWTKLMYGGNGYKGRRP